MCCYNNDILPHKALVFSWPRMATCPKGDPLCRSTTLNLTLLPALSWSTVSPWSFSSFSVCTAPLSVLPYLSVRGYLHAFHPTQTFLSQSFGKLEAPSKWFTSMADCLQPLVFKGSCYSVCLRIPVSKAMSSSSTGCSSNPVKSTVPDT